MARKKKEYVYIVVELNEDGMQKILNVHRNKDDANQEAYKDTLAWRNIIKKEVIE